VTSSEIVAVRLVVSTSNQSPAAELDGAADVAAAASLRAGACGTGGVWLPPAQAKSVTKPATMPETRVESFRRVIGTLDRIGSAESRPDITIPSSQQQPQSGDLTHKLASVWINSESLRQSQENLPARVINQSPRFSAATFFSRLASN
jgi:hypothetical protein